MSYIFSPTAEIYDFLEMIRNDEDKWIKKLKNLDGTIFWKVGRKEFGQNFNEAFDDMVIRGELWDVVDGNYRLTEIGEKELKEFSRIGI